MPWYSVEPSRDALLAGRWFGMIVCYLRDGDRVFETYWATGRATEAMGSVYGLLDMTVYGRQETLVTSPSVRQPRKGRDQAGKLLSFPNCYSVQVSSCPGRGRAEPAPPAAALEPVRAAW